MNPHLKRIPRLTPLPTRRLPRRDLQALGRQAHGALDAQVLGFGALDQLLADFLEGLHFAGGERDADLVGFLLEGMRVSGVLSEGHFGVGVRGYRHILSRAFGRPWWRWFGDGLRVSWG